MAKIVLHKRSNVTLSDGKPKIPTSEQLDYGEIAVNYAKDVETLSIKNTNNEVVTFSNEVIVDSTDITANKKQAKLFIKDDDASPEIKYNSNGTWKTLQITGGGSSGSDINVVQTTGSSTSDVMSQNAVTEQLKGKANTSHTHDVDDISGLQNVAKSGSYNDLTDKPSIPSPYVLPKASSSTLGGIKVGAGLSVAGDGTLSTTGGGVADSVEWDNVVGKPPTFTPSEHTHKSSDITDLSTVLAGYATDSELTTGLANKANVTHTHTIANITNLQTTLDGKANTSHTHKVDNISNLGDGWALALVNNSITESWGRFLGTNIYWESILATPHGTGWPDAFKVNLNPAWVTTFQNNPTASFPTLGDGWNEALAVTLGSGWADAFQSEYTPGSGGGSTINVVQTTGSSTSDVMSQNAVTEQLKGKANTSHTHTIANITNLQNTLDDKADASHTHTTSQITDLTTILEDYVTDSEFTSGLAGKANISHTHNISDITNLQNTLNGKAATSHTHTTSQITDLSTVLGGYATDSELTTGLAGKANITHTHTVNQISNLGSGWDYILKGTIGSAWYDEFMNDPSFPTLGNGWKNVLEENLTGFWGEALTSALGNGWQKVFQFAPGQEWVNALTNYLGTGWADALHEEYDQGSDYVLPLAANGTRGGIQIGYAQTSNNRAVQLSAEKAYVNIPNATTDTSGLMTTTQVNKLNGIATNANYYVHPTTAGNKHIPTGGSSGQILRWKSSGTAAWGAESFGSTEETRLNSLYNSAFVGFSTTSGSGNIVLNNASGSATIRFKSLSNDRVNECTIPAATQSSPGLLSSSDKKKLDGLSSTGIDTTYIAYTNKGNNWTAYQDFKSGAGNSGSDMRFKENVEKVDNVLNDILNVDVISYTWNKEGETKRNTFGVNANALEEMGGLFANIVHERNDEEKTKWVEYDRIGVLLLQAFKEYVSKTDEKIKMLESEIQLLKNK